VIVRSAIVGAVVMLAGAAPTTVAVADEVKPEEDAAVAEAPAEKKETRTTPEKATASKPNAKPAGRKPTLDEQLLKELIGEDEPADDDPLERAIEGMRDAQKKLADKETGKPTRDVQEQVIKDIEKLIELAKQPPPPSQNPNQSRNPRPKPKPQDQPDQNDRPESKPESSGSSGAPQTADQKTESDRARESTDEQRQAREREAELARRRDMIKDIWGHLPPSLRQKLLNVGDEKTVPKYDDLVRRYFESLAEEGTSNTPKRRSRAGKE